NRREPAAPRRPGGVLEPPHAAQRRRLAHRAAGLRAERGGHRARSHECSRTAPGSARHPRLVERVERAAVRRMLGGRPHAELVAVRLTGDERARRLQLRHRGRFVRRAVALEDLRAAARGELERANVVLYRHRHTVQDARWMRPRRLRDERFAELFDRSETGIQPLDLDDAVGRRLGARERFAGIAHAPASSNCPSLGTRKKPSRNAGANSAGPNASGQGFTSSARNRTASGPGTNGFTPSLAGTALIWATYSRIRDICSAKGGSASSLTSSSASRAILWTSSSVTLMRSPTHARARRRPRAA